jgi:hypothetical protein
LRGERKRAERVFFFVFFSSSSSWSRSRSKKRFHLFFEGPGRDSRSLALLPPRSRLA